MVASNSLLFGEREESNEMVSPFLNLSNNSTFFSFYFFYSKTDSNANILASFPNETMKQNLRPTEQSVISRASPELEGPQ